MLQKRRVGGAAAAVVTTITKEQATRCCFFFFVETMLMMGRSNDVMMGATQFAGAAHVVTYYSSKEACVLQCVVRQYLIGRREQDLRKLESFQSNYRFEIVKFLYSIVNRTQEWNLDLQHQTTFCFRHITSSSSTFSVLLLLLLRSTITVILSSRYY